MENKSIIQGIFRKSIVQRRSSSMVQLVAQDDISDVEEEKPIANQYKKQQVFKIPEFSPKSYKNKQSFKSFKTMSMDLLNSNKQYQSDSTSNEDDTQCKSKNVSKIDKFMHDIQQNNKQYVKIRFNLKSCEQTSLNNIVQLIKVQDKKILKLPPIQSKSNQIRSPPDFESIKKEIQSPQYQFKLSKLRSEGEEQSDKLENDDMLYLNGKKKYFVKWVDQEQISWKPIARANSSFVIFKNKGYMYGGTGQLKMNDIQEFSFQTFKWKPVEQNGEIPLEGRSGHTAFIKDNQMFIFGGELSFDHFNKQRKCLNDIRSFNLQNNKWDWPLIITGSNNNINKHQCIKIFLGHFGYFLTDPRRNHVGTLVENQYYFVHGGVNTQNKTMSDVWVLDFSKLGWQKLNVQFEDDEFNTTASFHQCCYVIHPERKSIQVFRQIEKMDEELVKHEGIYFFGGKNNSNECTNDLFVLNIFHHYPYWIKPQCAGIPPSKRCEHQMQYIQQLGSIIVYGGKNDQNELEHAFMDDIYLLKVKSLTWIKAEVSGIKKEPRASFSSVIIDTQLICFGGFNKDGWIGTDIHILEVNENKINTQNQKQLDEEKVNVNNFVHNKPQFLLPTKRTQILTEVSRTQQKIQELKIKKMLSYYPQPYQMKKQTQLQLLRQ